MNEEVRPQNYHRVLAFHGEALQEHYEKLVSLHIEQLVEICHMMTDVTKDNPSYLLPFLHKIKTKLTTLASSLDIV